MDLLVCLFLVRSFTSLALCDSGHETIASVPPGAGRRATDTQDVGGLASRRGAEGTTVLLMNTLRGEQECFQMPGVSGPRPCCLHL